MKAIFAGMYFSSCPFDASGRSVGVTVFHQSTWKAFARDAVEERSAFCLVVLTKSSREGELCEALDDQL